MNEADLTPLMRQYWEVKRSYQDAILFFRVGDFYEMFYKDAEEASQLLSIALTSRDKARADPVPLCGVPYHAATGYIAKLLKAGRTVALCDQVEDPQFGKGLVRREVVRLYTPGTLIDAELLPATESNFLAAVVVSSRPSPLSDRSPSLGLAALDLSTGEFWVMELQGDQAQVDLQSELARLEPRELLYPMTLQTQLQPVLDRLKGLRLCAQELSCFELASAEHSLMKQFGVDSLDGFGCQGLSLALQAAGAVMRYLRETQPTACLDHVRRLKVRHPDHEMHLDSVTIRNLELIRPLADNPALNDQKQPTLLSVLNRTVTVLGTRLLRDWIIRPLVKPTPIQARLDAVAELVQQLRVRAGIRTALKTVQDVARLSSRISLGAANPRDVLALKQSAAALPEIRTHLTVLSSSLLQDLARSWDDLADIHKLIEGAILSDAPVSTRDGGLIKDGYYAPLDELRKARREGKGWIAELEAREREHTGIESLKVRFNQVFGYYIEVTKANLARVPAHYIRKQTLVNAERFTTAELKELEEKVTGAELKLNQLEQELFEEIRAKLAQETPRVQVMASVIAALDVLTALAETAVINRYVRPDVDRGGTIRITEGRHPVVERLALPGGFIPNDTLLDLETNRLLIITGPNMAGKSTYLRQVALIVLMAQMGSFVPARAACVGLVDRIFTRVGASDNLAGGQSTFMVEMTETAQILNCATARSLILLDEIGRGTSTYDGLSIAWAVAEYIQDRRHLGARTLFASHYHEMTQLAELREGVKNYSVSVRERSGEVLFLRRIVEGGADRSYGIYVARLAGLPAPVVTRAQEVLAQLERPTAGVLLDQALESEPPSSDHSLPQPHPIIKEVRQMDLFSMTPLEALNRLAELQRRLEDEKRP
ncbi:MAG TPA: DNA mismatch repair protein MutS [Nitrospiraceae bacterium]|nr:DNA mismatch repair protein MutS [Nitrospiraceae bacterium]